MGIMAMTELPVTWWTLAVASIVNSGLGLGLSAREYCLSGGWGLH